MTPKYPDIEVQLTGEDGNAFFIISRTAMAMKRAGVDIAEIDAFRDDAMNGDYDHVLRTVMATVAVQ